MTFNSIFSRLARVVNVSGLLAKLFRVNLGKNLWTHRDIFQMMPYNRHWLIYLCHSLYKSKLFIFGILISISHIIIIAGLNLHYSSIESGWMDEFFSDLIGLDWSNRLVSISQKKLSLLADDYFWTSKQVVRVFVLLIFISRDRTSE